mmetsp:Transcript_11782/g.16129  ORF Transcript_11782/g.16129 Transcript_11782/m.16129 type:complete len:113 (+) Transcript_11782:79-417(+)
MEPPPESADIDFSEIFAGDKIAFNTQKLNYCRVFAAIASGCVAGVLGLTGLLGFFVFFVTSLLLSAGLYLKVGCEPTPYFRQSSDVWFEGVMQAMLSYIFFWTLFYDIVHVY